MKWYLENLQSTITQSSFPLANDSSTLEAPITPVHFKYFFTRLITPKQNLAQSSEQRNGLKTEYRLRFVSRESSSIVPRGEMANSLAPGQNPLHPHQND